MPFTLKRENESAPHHSAAQTSPRSPPSCLLLLFYKLSSLVANLAAPAFNDVTLLGKSWDREKEEEEEEEKKKTQLISS